MDFVHPHSYAHTPLRLSLHCKKSTQGSGTSAILLFRNLPPLASLQPNGGLFVQSQSAHWQLLSLTRSPMMKVERICTTRAAKLL